MAKEDQIGNKIQIINEQHSPKVDFLLFEEIHDKFLNKYEKSEKGIDDVNQNKEEKDQVHCKLRQDNNCTMQSNTYTCIHILITVTSIFESNISGQNNCSNNSENHKEECKYIERFLIKEILEMWHIIGHTLYNLELSRILWEGHPGETK